MSNYPRWTNVAYRHECLVNKDGKIIGEIRGSNTRWTAIANEKPLGDFISMEAAKRAVQVKAK